MNEALQVIRRMAHAGFRLEASGERLRIYPFERLTAVQRDWLATHKPALVAVLAAEHWRWCVEYPRWWVKPDSGTRLVLHYSPEADWRQVSADHPGAAAWPMPDDLDVVAWINEGMPS